MAEWIGLNPALISCMYLFPCYLEMITFVILPSVGECLGGALWWKDLYKIAEEVGFLPPRLVAASRITLANKELENAVGKSTIFHP